MVEAVKSSKGEALKYASKRMQGDKSILKEAGIEEKQKDDFEDMDFDELLFIWEKNNQKIAENERLRQELMNKILAQQKRIQEQQEQIKSLQEIQK